AARRRKCRQCCRFHKWSGARDRGLGQAPPERIDKSPRRIMMWPGSSPSAVVNGAAGMTIAALVIAGLYAGQDLLIPLALAGLLGFVLAPLVRRPEIWRIPNGLAVALVIGASLAALFGGATIAGREVAQLLEELPKHEANLRDKARFLQFELG